MGRILSRILICGKSGAGKTYFSNLLRREIDCFYFNADLVRELANDKDFSLDGRIRQAKRMKLLANNSPGVVVCDFICPTPELRKIFAPDIIVYVEGGGSKYPDSDKLFVPPQKNEAANLLTLQRGREVEVLDDVLFLVSRYWQKQLK